MNFVKHSELEGLHATFGASQYHWLRYSDEKFDEVFKNRMAAAHGDRLHALASELIKLGIKLPRTQKTLNLFVNDAIGFKMESEVVLYYSPYFFGTTDAISFRKRFLRIHDLKTGKTRSSMDQLLIYAALFCLEYEEKPGLLEGIELRIYKDDDIYIYEPAVEEIAEVISKIQAFNRRVEYMLAQGVS
jgi:hypothetical protein